MQFLPFLLTLVCLVGSSLAAVMKSDLVPLRAAAKDGVIDVKPEDFEVFFNSKGLRDYHLAALLTTSNPASGCALCQKVEPVFYEVSRTVRKSQPDANVFFVKVDASNRDNLMNLKKYKVKSVPQMFVYPPFEDLYKLDDADPLDTRMVLPVNLNVTSEHYAFPASDRMSSSDVELGFAKFIAQTCHADVKINKSFEWMTIVQSFLIVTVIIKIIKRNREKAKLFFLEPRFWCGISMMLCYINMSGVNFCTQRAVPFIMRTASGSITYLTGSISYQEGFEIILSIGFQIGFSLLLIGLLVLPGKLGKNGDMGNAGAATLAVAFLLFLWYNCFTTAFTAKDRGYPFNAIKMFDI